MKTMKKLTTQFAWFFVVIAGIAIYIVSALWQNAYTFIGEAMNDSKDIRVAEANNCVASENQEKAHFSGCNSII